MTHIQSVDPLRWALLTFLQRFFLLMIMALFVVTTPGFAQNPQTINLTVYVSGVQGRLRDNVAAYLSINQIADPPASEQEAESVPLLGEAKQVIDTLSKPVKQAEQALTRAEQPLGRYQLQVSESRLRWLHSKAEEEIQQALQPYGYYQPTIEANLTQTGPQNWVARYKIDRGPPIRIANAFVDILGDGRDDPAFQELLAKNPFKKGNILIQPRYEEFKQALQFLATQRGYFDAQLLAQTLRINPEQQEARVVLRFDTGQRYRFGQINFSDTALAPDFLRRYLKFQADDPYTTDELLTLQSDLINSDYFKRVTVNAPVEEAENKRIPVDVDLVMNDSRQLSFGLGYGTDTGVRGRLGYEYRWLNRWGHRLKLEALGSQIRQAATAEYILPGADPSTDFFNLRAGFAREDTDVKDTALILVGGSWNQRFGLWQQILSLDYTIESFRTDERITSRLLVPSASWIRTELDDPLNIRWGNMFELTVSGANESLLSDLSFLQAIGRGKVITPVGERGRLIGRTDLGTTTASSFAELPTSFRFFAGGDNSVRGFELDKIGPRNRDGDIVGAKHLIVGSLEYEHRFYESWGAAVFVDSGDAFNESPDFKTGVGVGVRWFSPIGPVRIDLAHGLEDPGDTIRLHLSIGPEL
jgi:translocation and assembly module TamA